MDGKRCWHPPSGKIWIELFHSKMQLDNVGQRTFTTDMPDQAFHRTGDACGIFGMICSIIYRSFDKNEVKRTLVKQITLNTEGVWDTAHAWDTSGDKGELGIWKAALQICHHVVTPATVVGDRATEKADGAALGFAERCKCASQTTAERMLNHAAWIHLSMPLYPTRGLIDFGKCKMMAIRFRRALFNHNQFDGLAYFREPTVCFKCVFGCRNNLIGEGDCMPHRDTGFCDINSQINRVAPELQDIFIFCKAKFALGILPLALTSWPFLRPAGKIHDRGVAVDTRNLVRMPMRIPIRMHPAAGHAFDTALFGELVAIEDQVAEALHDA